MMTTRASLVKMVGMDKKDLPKNVIVKMPNWIGDAVMATPVLQDLRGAFPEARLTALCQSNIAPLLESDPNLNEVIAYKKPSGWIHRAEHYDVISPLQQGEYDLGILMTNSFTSAWWFWRGGVQRRIGYAGNLRSWLLTDAVPKPKKIETQHLVITYKMLLEPLGIPVSATAPKLFLSADEERYKKTFFETNNIKADDVVLGINPGAAYGTAKCWPPERFKELTKMMLDHPNIFVVYFGDQSSAPMIDAICQEMPQERVLNLAGKTNLRQLIALISACSVFLTNDSGPMHLASALKIPLVALFGSTSDIKTGPYNGGLVIHKHVECSPCYKRVCPIDFRCMTRISAEEVQQQLDKLIASWKQT